jgi:hypothetical protein
VGGSGDVARLFEPADIIADLQGSGLRVEVAEERLRPVDGSERPAIDVLVRARRPGRSGEALRAGGDPHAA